MRRVLLVAWITLLPLGGLYHLVAGSEHQEMDQLGRELAEARELVQQEQWGDALPHFETALGGLPKEMLSQSRQIRLEMAQAKMNASRLPEAHGDLKGLLDEILMERTEPSKEPKPDTHRLERSVRESLANSQFYMTWLMRLEGLPHSEWEPEIESARQNYRMLAEAAKKSGRSSDAKRQQENLEATIRLARLDLTDLQGLPLPNQ
ncbi:MAG TPA: hypothetical protein DCG12_21995 [Planctomycetaceae bacterium]|nr:hypothetical protein [Planctomycetaceae bacterium]